MFFGNFLFFCLCFWRWIWAREVVGVIYSHHYMFGVYALFGRLAKCWFFRWKSVRIMRCNEYASDNKRNMLLDATTSRDRERGRAIHYSLSTFCNDKCRSTQRFPRKSIAKAPNVLHHWFNGKSVFTYCLIVHGKFPINKARKSKLQIPYSHRFLVRG